MLKDIGLPLWLDRRVPKDKETNGCLLFEDLADANSGGYANSPRSARP